MTVTSMLNLPEEVFVFILEKLPLSSIHQLGAVCHGLHLRIHQNGYFWHRKVRQQLDLFVLDPDYGLKDQEWWPQARTARGLIQDPTIQGAKELFLLYSKEFQSFATASKNKEKSDLEKLVQYFWSHFSKKAEDDRSNTPARLALFGPGIESPRTKHLVHRMVNAHDNCLNAISFVPGLPGGFGSGVRIDFKQLYTFDLMCLYSNSKKVRESHNGLERLLASHNRLLAKAQWAVCFNFLNPPSLPHASGPIPARFLSFIKNNFF
jgi:hypothetical protein